MSEPLVIVGAGVAGLTTALAAAPARVVLLSRGVDGKDSATALAQGGIAAAVGCGDSVEAHVIDTLAAGALHNDAARVLWLCSQAPEAVAWLERQGVAFDRDGSGAWRLGREGGHGDARVLHAGGDASGDAIWRALAARVREAAHVRWLAGIDVDALRLRGGRACGVRGVASDGSRAVFDARAVVVATGGVGALFARTTNPGGADGAGLALALAAGARGRDLEFVQFHPTALDVPGCAPLPLITEALRGAGARLRGVRGRLLMDRAHPLGDLAPRDVVARRVWAAQRRGERVVLDATCVPCDWSQAFPGVFATCRAHGIDPRAEPIPVTPAAHFHMGGVAVDADGCSALPGLYAVGEAACNGIHGANRLASNSLLEGVACGRRLGARLARRTASVAAGEDVWHALGPGLPPARLHALRELLWSAAGPLRSRNGLRRALETATAWSAEGWQARVAAAMLVSALRRRESLGAHWHLGDADVPPVRRRLSAV